MNSLSPIILFTYLRFEKLKITVEALSENLLASKSDLIIFSDGAKNSNDQKTINEIRSYLKTIEGFKSVTIHESLINQGLANSIIKGVSKVLEENENVIVLEDDLVTSKNFLDFMNSSLDRYRDDKAVFSISGYCFDFSYKLQNSDGYFLIRPNSWGWAVWKDRWDMIDWELPNLNTKQLNQLLTLGSDVKKMFIEQKNSKIDSWHIKFIYNQFKFSGLTFYPKISKVNNIGFDKFATHTKYGSIRFSTFLDDQNHTNFIFPDEFKNDKLMYKALLSKLSFTSRIINRVFKFFHFGK